VAKLRLLPAYSLWLRDEAGQALRIVSRSAALSDSRQDTATVHSIANFYLLLGRLRDAERWWKLEENAMDRESAFAMIAFDRGDVKAMGRHLRLIKETPGARLLRLPFLLLRAGLLTDAESEIQATEKLGLVPPNYFDIARGEVCLARGRKEEGIALLRQGLKIVEVASGASLMGSKSLAGVLEKDGKLKEAAEVLERAAESLGRIAILYGYDTGSMWMKNRIQLAGLYRRMGREQEARKIEDELRKLLACADPDHALVRELNQPRPAAKIALNGS
jgi:tetratricopeptide (TPR) repeat protein